MKNYMFWIIVIIMTVLTVTSAFAAFDYVDLAHVYQFESLVGGDIVVDSVGGFNGTEVGTSTVGANIIYGNAIYFQGDESYVNFSTVSMLPTGANQWSISFWVKSNDVGGSENTIIGQWSGNNPERQWQINLFSNAVRNMSFTGYDTAIKTVDDFGNGIRDGQWHHSVIRFNGTGIEHFFDNKTEPGYSMAFTGIQAYDGTRPLLMGIKRVPGYTFKGWIDEMYIYNKSLTREQIGILSANVSDSFYNDTLPVIDNFTIIANNYWNSTSLQIFNATINDTFYTTTNGVINSSVLSNSSSLHNITIIKNGYINRTYLNVNVSSQLQALIYTTITNLTAREINTNSTIINWTLSTDNGNYSTTNGSIIIYPNIATYTWNWSSPDSYITYRNIQFVINEQHQNSYINNLFARNVTFTNNLSLAQQIAPLCIQSGYSYSSYPYYMPNLTSSMVCSLFGYNNITLSLNSTPDTSDYKMQPVRLYITFSEQTSGFIETSDCSAAPDNCISFNDTSIITAQFNISTGYVTIKFNPDGSGNFQQIYKYYNDNNTNIRDYIEIITPDLAQEVKVTGENQPLANARVVAEKIGTNPDTNNTEWISVYAEYTNSDGFATILVNDQNTYKITVQHDDYITDSIIEYIPPSNTNTILIDLDPAETETEYNYIQTSCPPLYWKNLTCTLEVLTYRPYNTICFDYTISGSTSSQCISDSTGTTMNYNFNPATVPIDIQVYLDGILANNFTHNRTVFNQTVDIGWDMEQNSTSFMTKIENDLTFLTVTYLLMAFIGIMIGFLFEKYFNGYGIYGTGIFYMFISISGLFIFYIPTIIITIHFLLTKLMPLWGDG